MLTVKIDENIFSKLR